MYGKPNNGTQDNFVPQNRSRDEAPPQAQHVPQGADGERGLGATVLGGAGGAFLGHKMEGGALGTIGGLAIGAIAANAFEHHHEKKKEERREERSYDAGYERGERRGSGSRSRGIDDDYYYRHDDRYEDDEEDYRPRHHHHHHHHDRDEDYYRDDDRDNYYDDGYRDNYRDDYYERY